MSLLSSTQGTPERVWSLVRLLQAHQGCLAREAVLGWLSPPFVQNRETRRPSGELDGQAIGAATSLDLVRREGGGYVLTAQPPPTFGAFADQVHARLCQVGPDDPDFLVLEAFAWVVVEVERQQSTAWTGLGLNAFADAVEHAIGSEDPDAERRFNATKVAPWRRWIVLFGLGLEMPGAGFYPYVAERVLREVEAADLPREVDLPARQALGEIARRMPYLDGGSLFLDLCGRTGLRLPAQKLSRVLSVALRDLNDEGSLVMGLRGDSSDRFELAADGQHQIQTFQTLRLRGRTA